MGPVGVEQRRRGRGVGQGEGLAYCPSAPGKGVVEPVTDGIERRMGLGDPPRVAIRRGAARIGY
jgi:hypothetical protein